MNKSVHMRKLLAAALLCTVLCLCVYAFVNLTVEGGERIAILGDTGTGKTTFLKCLLGDEDCAGRVQYGPTVKAG